MAATFADLVPSQMTAKEYDACRRMMREIDDPAQVPGTCPACRKGKLHIAAVCIQHPMAGRMPARHVPGCECGTCGYVKLLHK